MAEARVGPDFRLSDAGGGSVADSSSWNGNAGRRQGPPQVTSAFAGTIGLPIAGQEPDHSGTTSPQGLNMQRGGVDK